MAPATRSNRRPGLAVAAILLLGCDPEATPGGDVVRPEGNGSGNGELRAHFDAEGSIETACGTAEGIRLALVGPQGQAVVCEETWTDVAVAGDTGGEHRIADCFLVVAPGDWRFTELGATDADFQALPCCTADYPERVTVAASETTEVGASIACEPPADGDSGGSDGGLDVDVTVGPVSIHLGL